MPRPKFDLPAVSSGQATYVMDRLIKERRVSRGEVNRYVMEMGREISDLEQRLQQLREGPFAARTRGQTGIRPKPARGGKADRAHPLRRKHPFDPVEGFPPAKSFLPPVPVPPKDTPKKVRAAVTPSNYLALLWKMPPKQRAYYAKIARTKGRMAAIKAMRATLRR